VAGIPYRKTSARFYPHDESVQEIYNAVILMQEALEKCHLEEMKANQAWLAFWEIHKQPNVTPRTYSAG
jgi:hypothetical protein